MADLFHSDDSIQNNSFESSSLQFKLKDRPIGFFQIIGIPLEISSMKDGNIEKERPSQLQQTGYQLKVSAVSSTKRIDSDQIQEFMPTKNESIAFNQDEQESQIDIYDSHQISFRRCLEANFAEKNRMFEKFGANLEDLGRQNCILEKVENTQKKQQQKNQTPKIATRNMLQYFWKVFKNYFTGKKQQLNPTNFEQIQKMRQIWREMGDLKPSLASFTKLFKNHKMRPYFKEIFKSRFLMREIVSSSLKQNIKATYFRYVKVLLKGFLSKDLQFLN